MKKVIGVFLIIILIIVGFAAYAGFVPFLSPLLIQPRDLGMTADPALVTAFEQKHAPKDGSPRADIDVTLSSEELTSVFAVWATRDPNFPLYNTQIKIGKDGIGEASGILRISTAVSLAKSLGYSDTDIEKGKSYATFISVDLPFYVKGIGGMTNNTLIINPAVVEIGRVSLPDSIVSPLKSIVTDMIYRRLDQIGGAQIQEAVMVPGGFSVRGNVPSTITY